jgi:hypothetical protein
MMNCDCIKLIDEKLSERNLALDTMLLLSNPGGVALYIGTHFADKDKKKRGERPTNLLVSFCPFCGVKVADE